MMTRDWMNIAICIRLFPVLLVILVLGTLIDR